MQDTRLLGLIPLQRCSQYILQPPLTGLISINVTVAWAEMFFYWLSSIRLILSVVASYKIKWPFWLSNLLLLAAFAIQQINYIYASAIRLVRDFKNFLSCETNEWLGYIYIYIYICKKFISWIQREKKVNILKWIGPLRDLFFFKNYLFPSYMHVCYSLLLSPENICGTRPCK